MAKQSPLSLFQFQDKFASEDACEDHMFKLKWSQGFCCTKCGHEHFYVIRSRRLKLFECKQCGHQDTVTAGTIMENTRTPLRKWFLAIYLAAQDKRGVSATLIAKEVEVAYGTAWLMLHKIRHGMTERDSFYVLEGFVEMDDTYFGAPTEGGKRGRGTDKTKVVVGVSLNSKGHPLFIKMQVVENLKGETLLDFAKICIQQGSTVISDGLSSYGVFTGSDFVHNPLVFDPQKNPDHLKWLHTIISNAKAFIGGTYHGLDSKHLPAYLNEFCYRFNRRKFTGEIFNRLLHCCCLTSSITLSELTA
jgi:transposase-like protein